jgi:hypothetical protein
MRSAGFAPASAGRSPREPRARRATERSNP